MDKYRRVRKLGEGAFGKAFLVSLKAASDKKFVMKEINTKTMKPKEKEAAMSEVATLSQLDHRNIVAYKESFQDRGCLYIVMEFCDAGDLYSRIRSQNGVYFTEEQILNYFVQICLGIKHVHDRKILHRDIKTQNIFLTKNGIVKLGDFGIAKIMNSTVELARTWIGTPFYLSPEICDQKPYNNKTDIWSLGCVLYELATLKHAFEAHSMKAVILKIIRGTYSPIPPRYSYDLRLLLQQMFRRNPHERPSANTILRKDVIAKRVNKFLPQHEIQEEFSHTIMHGQKLAKKIPLGPHPKLNKDPAVVPAPVRRPLSARSVENMQKAYGQRVGPPAAKRPPSAGRRRGGGAGAMQLANQQAANVRLAELQRKRDARREAHRKKMESMHDDFVEKQRVAQINEARERGWRNVAQSPDLMNNPPPAPLPMLEHGGPRGDYARYHDQLNQMGGGGVAASMVGRGGDGVGLMLAQNVAQREHVGEEFRQRKQAALMNKQRHMNDLYGNRPAMEFPAENREAQEQEYLAKLRQIRMQNYNDKKQLRKQGPLKMVVDGDDGAAERRKKIEALRAQADARAEKIKKDLENKREQFFKNRKPQQRAQSAGSSRPSSAQNAAARAVEQRAVPVDVKRAVPEKRAVSAVPVVAEPPIRMTEVLNQIGIAPAPADKVVDKKWAPPAATALAQKPLEAKWEDQATKGGALEKMPLQEDQRPKWEAGTKGTALANMPIAVTPDIKAVPSKWNAGVAVENPQLGQLPLEETGSQMEKTKGEMQRKGWGPRGETIVHALAGTSLESDGATSMLQQATSTTDNLKQAGVWKAVYEAENSVVPSTDVAGKESEDAPDGNILPDAHATVDDGEGKSHKELQRKGTFVISKKAPENDQSKKTEDAVVESTKQQKESSERTIEPENAATEVERPAHPTDKYEQSTDTMGQDQQSTVIDESAPVSEKKDRPRTSASAEPAVISDDLNSSHSSMKDSLLVGEFDLQNPKLLRSCSLPDLDKVDKKVEEADLLQPLDPAEEELFVTASLDLARDDDDDDESLATEYEKSLQALEDDDYESELLSTEDWHSDDGESTFGDDQKDLFSKLEEDREDLELKLGLDVFKKAYKHIKAVYDNEECSLEDCFKDVVKIIGEEKSSIYPRLLRFVIQDCAYTEDSETVSQSSG